jgi:hypothetical protein
MLVRHLVDGWLTRADGPEHEDPFVRMEDVLSFHREHWPGRYDALLEPEDSHAADNDTRVVLPDEIRQFYPSGPERWMDYGEILQRFARLRMSGGGTRIAPYKFDAVFADWRIVLAESDRPIRCYLTHEPTYPVRGKLALLKSPWASTSAFVAVAVLNSSIGLALYHEFFEIVKGRPSRSSDGLMKDVLKLLPVKHHDTSPALFHDVARFAYALSMLCAAERDCKEDFSEYIVPIRLRVLHLVSLLLKLTDEQAEYCFATARALNAQDAPSPQLTLTTALREQPLRDQIIILHRDERTLFENLSRRVDRDELSTRERHELSRLWTKWNWEKLINAYAGKDAGQSRDGELYFFGKAAHYVSRSREDVHEEKGSHSDLFQTDPLLSNVVFHEDPCAPLDLCEWPEAFTG